MTWQKLAHNYTDLGSCQKDAWSPPQESWFKVENVGTKNTLMGMLRNVTSNDSQQRHKEQQMKQT